jgi:DnaJ family protein A protein 5
MVSAAAFNKSKKKRRGHWVFPFRHPDKNRGNLEEADAKFKDIQKAYTVLSDVHERAWYDAHREAILKGDDGTGQPGDEQVGVNLFPFFSESCFKAYDESTKVCTC